MGSKHLCYQNSFKIALPRCFKLIFKFSKLELRLSSRLNLVSCSYLPVSCCVYTLKVTVALVNTAESMWLRCFKTGSTAPRHLATFKSSLKLTMQTKKYICSSYTNISLTIKIFIYIYKIFVCYRV